MDIIEALADIERSNETELDFIYRIELRDRTKYIMERDNVSEEIARARANRWLQDETGSMQLELIPSEETVRHYRVEYTRFDQKPEDDYGEALIRVRGKLYSWKSTNSVLAEIIRNDHDKRCDKVVVFIEMNRIS